MENNESLLNLGVHVVVKTELPDDAEELDSINIRSSDWQYDPVGATRENSETPISDSEDPNNDLSQCPGDTHIVHPSHTVDNVTGYIPNGLVTQIKTEPPDDDDPINSDDNFHFQSDSVLFQGPKESTLIFSENSDSQDTLPGSFMDMAADDGRTSNALSGMGEISKNNKQPHQCSMCGQKFLGVHILAEHMRVHGIKHVKIPKSLTCDLCGKSFKCTLYLNKHIKRHKESIIKRYKCDQCGKRYCSSRDLKRHAASHSGERTQVCNICGKSFIHKTSLQRHLITHTDEKPYMCSSCGQRFKSRSGRAKHMDNCQVSRNSPPTPTEPTNDNPVPVALFKAAHTLPKPVAADLDSCDNFVSSQSPTDGDKIRRIENERKTLKPVRIRIRKSTPFPIILREGASEINNLDGTTRQDSVEIKTEIKSEVGTPHMCVACGNQFDTETELQDHIQDHAWDKPFVCTLCGQNLLSKASLRRHVKSHAKDKPYMCQTCGKGYVERCDYRAHMRIHTGERPYMCRECGNTFTTKTVYREHLKIHTNERAHNCSECEKSFITNRALKRHVASHSAARPYKCDRCSSTYKTVYCLRRHIRLHDGWVPFFCKVCYRTFSHQTDYKRHIRTHTGERPFKCAICSKGFKQNQHLSDHMITHSGEKPYLCEFCPQRCSTKSSLRKHLKRHEPGGNLQCMNELI